MTRTSQEELYDDRSLLVKMNDLDTKVDGIEDDVGELETTVTTLQTTVAGKQDKLTSANAGQNITITEEGGVPKINASLGGITVSHGIKSVDGDVRLDPDKVPTIVKSVEATGLTATEATITVKSYDTEADTANSAEITIPSADLTNDKAGLYNKTIDATLEKSANKVTTLSESDTEYPTCGAVKYVTDGIEDELGDASASGTIRGDIAALQTAVAGKSKVEWTQEQTTGTEIAKIKIDGGTEISVKAPSGGGGSSVSWSQEVTTGTKIAEITIDSATTEVYAPTAGGGGTITEVKMNGATVATSGVADLGTVITAHQSLADYEKNADLDADVGTLGYTKNAGTITGIKMNGSSKGSSGEVDLGTVITEHQDISGKFDNPSNQSSASAGMILKKTSSGSKWESGGSGGTTRTLTSYSSFANFATALAAAPKGAEFAGQINWGGTYSEQIWVDGKMFDTAFCGGLCGYYQKTEGGSYKVYPLTYFSVSSGTIYAKYLPSIGGEPVTLTITSGSLYGCYVVTYS